MVLPRIYMLCALAALAVEALLAKQDIPEPVKIRLDREEWKERPNVAIREWRAARAGLGQHVAIGVPDTAVATAALAQRRRRCRKDGTRKLTKGQRKLGADGKSSKRKINLSRETGEHEDHHKLPHDIASKCSQAQKQKMKAKDIKTKHGELAKPPDKNGVPKGCEDPAISTTSSP